MPMKFSILMSKVKMYLWGGAYPRILYLQIQADQWVSALSPICIPWTCPLKVSFASGEFRCRNNKGNKTPVDTGHIINMWGNFCETTGKSLPPRCIQFKIWHIRRNKGKKEGDKENTFSSITSTWASSLTWVKKSYWNQQRLHWNSLLALFCIPEPSAKQTEGTFTRRIKQ